MFCSVKKKKRKKLQKKKTFNEDLTELVYSRIAEDSPKGKKTPISIAAFITARAHSKLYGYLDRLDDRVMYYDTDSMICKWTPGQSDVELRDHVGEMTSELDVDDYINELLSGGAENYEYVMRQEESLSVCEDLLLIIAEVRNCNMTS